MSDVEEKIIKITAETLNIGTDKVTRDSNFVVDLGVDSLDFVELMMAFEEAFGCDIPDEEATKITTIADAAACVKKHLSAA